MSITHPTPAEVAEARAWFDERTVGCKSADDITGWLVSSTQAQRRAAVLVRAALAAPAEQPREDYPDAEGLAALRGNAWIDPDCGCERSPDVPRGTPCPDSEHANAAARSVSPSAVPAVSAGGAGRDLTAQDVRDAWSAGCEVESGQAIRQFLADYLNRIARPADTGTQATEQTTEYRAICDVPGGEPVRQLFKASEFDYAADRVRWWRVNGMTDSRLETRTKTVSTSVSAWSPVAVHDEEQQR